jgi:hypothetical protein
MRSSTHRASRQRGRLVVVAAATAALMTGAMTAAAQSQAVGLLPTSVDISTSSHEITYDTSVTLKATLLPLGTSLPGVGFTPRGTITFIANAGEGDYTLGSVPVGGCFLRSCTVRLTTDGLDEGFNLVRAKYSGDLVFKGSTSNNTAIQVDTPPEPEPTSSDTNTCAAGQSCSTDTITADGGSTALTVSTPPSGQQNTVTASLTEGETLHCPGDDDTPPGSALATFTSTATDVEKTVVYHVEGPAAVTWHNNYVANGSLALGCYAADHPFNGYTNGAYGPATLVMEPFGDFYEAQLGSCANNGPNNRPCFSLLDGSALPNPYVEITIHTQPGDPKFI